MLDNLPPEIIEQILGHLPTASSIVHLSCANRKLYGIVSKNDYGVFRGFVQKAFPSVQVPPKWRDMACRLTTRSRAWDRRAFVARECTPSLSDTSGSEGLSASSGFGFTPIIDSYEELKGSRREVLAFGAAGRLRIRTTTDAVPHWTTMQFEDDHLPQHDIVNLHLLRPYQKRNTEGESVIVQRANRQVSRIERSETGTDDLVETAVFNTSRDSVSCTAVSRSHEPKLAVFGDRSLQIFPIHKQDSIIQSETSCQIVSEFPWKHRKRCATFLTDETIATCIQFVQGLGRAPILIYDISPTSLVETQLQSTLSALSGDVASPGRHGACCVSSLDATTSSTGRPGQVILSGWTDGVARLHDLRTPHRPVSVYEDPVDDGQIISIQPVGLERFFAGSHQNACLKMFDLRMSGARRYSYLEALPQTSSSSTTSAIDRKSSFVDREIDLKRPKRSRERRFGRDINIFLALKINDRGRLWQPLPNANVLDRRRLERLPRYRGSIYSLSSPSPSSPRIFAGIMNHVVQLDFVSTDDVVRKPDIFCANDKELRPDASSSLKGNIFDLSCYERPRAGFETTDPVLLRKQTGWAETVSTAKGRSKGEAEAGWDERWSRDSSWKDGHSSDRWRRR